MGRLRNFIIQRSGFVLTLFIFLGLSTPALANAGVPMIMLLWPFFWCALIPIILVEWLVLKKDLPALLPKRLFYVASMANLFSVLLGIPLAWLTQLGIQLATGGSGFLPLDNMWSILLVATLHTAWIVPYQGALDFLIPTAFMVLLIPCFFFSYWLEKIVALKLLRESSYPKEVIKKAVWRANKWSYAFLFFVSSIGVLYLAARHFKLLPF